MGQWHSHFSKSLGAEICAIVDLDESRARQLGQRFSCNTVYADVESMLARSEASVVHICTPTSTHARAIKQCLEAGRHVLVEKPLAENHSVTAELLNCAHDNGVLLNPVHQFPFQRGYLELIERKEELGKTVRVEYLTCSAGGEKKTAAQRKEVLLEILPHPVSLLLRLFPDAFEPRSVCVLRFTDDDLVLSAEIDDASASITISLRGRPTRNEFNYIAERGASHIDLFHGFAVFETAEVSRASKILKPFKFGARMLANASTNLARRAAASEPAYPGLRELIRQFYEAIATKGAPPIAVPEILLAAQLQDLVRESRVLS